MDGGVGQVLLNDGAGGLEAVHPRQSGVVVPGDGKSLGICDLNADGRPDLIFGRNNAAVATCVRAGGGEPLALRLAGSQIGALVSIGNEVRELAAGSGYSSQTEPVLYFSVSEESRTATVRWANGEVSEHEVEAGATVLTIKRP